MYLHCRSYIGKSCPVGPINGTVFHIVNQDKAQWEKDWARLKKTLDIRKYLGWGNQPLLYLDWKTYFKEDIDIYKEKILKATDLCTMVTGKRLGHPVRSLRTPFAREYSKAEYGGMPDEELEKLATGALRLAVQEGDDKKGCFLSGQIAAMVKKEQPAAEIVKEVMEEAEAVLLKASQWIK